MASRIADQFKGLPIGELISQPLIAAAQAQGKLAGITEQFIEEIGLNRFIGTQRSNGLKSMENKFKIFALSNI